MPEIDPTYQPRPWRCEECGATLGYVLRDCDRVRRLWLLRDQRHGSREPLPTVEILAAARMVRHSRHGIWRARGVDAAQGIGCDYCGSLQEWRPSSEALRDLIRMVRGDSGVRQFDALET